MLALAAAMLNGCAANLAPKEALPHTVAIRSASFAQGLGAAVAPGFLPGNKVQAYNNGDEIFPAMLAGIRSARRTINFETFIFEKGEVPDAFVAALEERARAGVRVNLILDAVGAFKSQPYHARLQEAGVQIEPFHSVWWIDPRRYNYRTHRKLLVIDGRVGFTGGVGIGDAWKGNARSPEEWRELHFRVEGPVVAQMQGAFESNWFHTRKEVLQGEDYFPALAPVGPARARTFISSPRQTRSAVEVNFQLVIASARHSLLIQSPYFMPGDALTDALCAAARRGVRVQVIMPGEHMDQNAVRRASRKKWPELMAAGVELYEFQPTMIHSKLMIADGYFVSVGSANFDPRSLRINDEANLDVLDTDFASRMTRIFNADLRRSKRVTPKESAPKLHEVPIQAAQAPVEPLL